MGDPWWKSASATITIPMNLTEEEMRQMSQEAFEQKERDMKRGLQYLKEMIAQMMGADNETS